jgi:hypothetical protein
VVTFQQTDDFFLFRFSLLQGFGGMGWLVAVSLDAKRYHDRLADAVLLGLGWLVLMTGYIDALPCFGTLLFS